MDELQALLDAANAKLDNTTAQHNLLVKRVEAEESKNSDLAVKLKAQADEYAQLKEDMKNDLADLEAKYKGYKVPGLGEVTIEMISKATHKAIGGLVKSAGMREETVAKQYTAESLKTYLVNNVKDALNLETTEVGLESIDQVLSRQIIERARETYPIIGEVGMRNMPRDLREQVLKSFPSVQKGIENVAGTTIAETDVQRYVEVKNKVAKVNAKPRITDEAMVGSDLNLYGDLLRLLDDEIGRYIALQIYYGDGSDKAMRGILSSNRLDITDGTGEAWKPTFGADARDADHFPAMGTGVATGLPSTDIAIVDWLIDITTQIPSKYLQGAKWHMNRRTLGRFKKVRDANDHPVFANGYKGDPMSILGYPVVLDDDMPDIAANAPFLIFGQLKSAFFISPGAIDKMLLDPYTVDGCTVVKVDKEIYEIVGANDAIIIGVATTNGA